MTALRALERRFPHAAGSAIVFAAAVLVIGLAVAAVLTAGNGNRTPGASHRSILPAPASTSTSLTSSSPVATREPVEPATQPALRFLNAYLAYSYGRGRASGIPDASPSVIRSLVRSRPRVPPAAARQNPRVTTLQVVRQGPRSVQATATVADGSGTQYPLVLFLDLRHRRWIVSGLGDD